MDDHDLRQAGLKVTTPRLRILKLFEDSQRHWSAEDIYNTLKEQGEDVGLATVYRVLTQFEQAGIAIKHNFEGGHSVYEIDDGRHHDHLVCLKCGKVIEFVDPVIEERQAAIASEHHFAMSDHNLTIYGTCENCST